MLCATRLGWDQPLVASYDRLQRFDLKVFLDVYGEEVRGRKLCRVHDEGERRGGRR